MLEREQRTKPDHGHRPGLGPATTACSTPSALSFSSQLRRPDPWRRAGSRPSALCRGSMKRLALVRGQAGRCAGGGSETRDGHGPGSVARLRRFLTGRRRSAARGRARRSWVCAAMVEPRMEPVPAGRGRGAGFSVVVIWSGCCQVVQREPWPVSAWASGSTRPWFSASYIAPCPRRGACQMVCVTRSS